MKKTVTVHEAAIILLEKKENVLAIARMYSMEIEVPENSIPDLLGAFKKAREEENFRVILNAIDMALITLEKNLKPTIQSLLKKIEEEFKKIGSEWSTNFKTIEEKFDLGKIKNENSLLEPTELWMLPKEMSNISVKEILEKKGNFKEFTLIQGLKKVLELSIERNFAETSKGILIYLSTKAKNKSKSYRLHFWKSDDGRIFLFVNPVSKFGDTWTRGIKILCKKNKI